jgi:hypothetical protein
MKYHEKSKLTSEDELYVASVFYVKLDSHEKGFGKNHPGQSTCECIRCEAKGVTGVIHYSVASNGHTTGQCETPNCVKWIE